MRVVFRLKRVAVAAMVVRVVATAVLALVAVDVRTNVRLDIKTTIKDFCLEIQFCIGCSVLIVAC